MTESIAGVKRIEFDFDFTYSKEGDETIGNTIILKAPGYDNYRLHSQLSAVVNKAFVKALPDLEKLGGKEDEEETKKPANDNSKDNNLFLMSLGMKDDDFAALVDKLKKKLTNNKALAHIENENLPLTDLFWKQVEEQGGMDAVDDVLSNYLGFFMGRIFEKKVA